MLKRTTKVISLLVCTASILSMVPAMAADIKKIDAKEGTVYSAKADIGQYFIDAELNGEDEAIYQVKDGKYTKLKNADPGDAMGDIDEYDGDNYLQMADGDYYVNLKTGERTDEDIKGNIDDDKATALRKNIKNNNDGRFDEITYKGDVVKKDSANIFGPTGVWSEFQYKLKTAKLTGDAYSSVYADRKGNYFDGDYNLGSVGVVTTESAVNIKNTEDIYEVQMIDAAGNKKTYELKAQVSNPRNQGESDDYLSRSIDLSIWAKEKGANDSTYTNVTDKVEFGSKNNHHPGVTDHNADGDYGVRVMQKLSKEVASGDIDGIKYPKTTSLYFASDEDGKAYGSKMLGFSNDYAVPDSIWWTSKPFDIEAQAIYYKSKNGYNYLDVQDVTTEDEISDWTLGCGELYVLSDGYVKKFDTKENEFVKLYKVDGGMNKVKVALQFNVVVWNEDDENYSIIDEPLPWAKADTTKTEEKAVTARITTASAVGWAKAADGTWSFAKADGTKTIGWYQDGTTWYYLNTTGVMQTGWIKDNETWYYCNGSGAMLANTTVNGYVLGASGAWVK